MESDGESDEPHTTIANLHYEAQRDEDSGIPLYVDMSRFHNQDAFASYVSMCP